MDTRLVFHDSRLSTAVDMICALVIGLGIGAFVMYAYVSHRPTEQVIVPQVHTSPAPVDTKPRLSPSTQEI